MKEAQMLLNVISNGVKDPLDIAKELPEWEPIVLGSALFQLLQNGWIKPDKEGNFIPIK